MLARYLRRLIAGIGLVSVALVVALWSQSPALALAATLLVPILLGVSLGLQFVAAALVNRGDPSPPATTRQLLQAWVHETVVAARMFFWWQPYRSHRHTDTWPDNTQAQPRRGIVFVHGFICNRGVWNAWYPVLDRLQIPHASINLEPVFASIEAYAATLDDAVTRMQACTGMAPMLVCHSMGGLAVRHWLRAHDADARLHRVITLGSPHRGTRISQRLPRLPWIANAQQMHFDSAWLTELARNEPRERHVKFVCFYSRCDNIVFPATSATLPEADNRHVDGVAHLALALDRRIMAQSLQML